MYSTGGNSAYELTSVVASTGRRSDPRHTLNLTAGLGCRFPFAGARNPGTTIVFYAQPKVSEDLWPVLFQVLRDDLAERRRMSYRMGLSSTSRQPSFVEAMICEDACSPGSSWLSYWAAAMCSRKQTIRRGARLVGYRWISGTIQPFISIDCTRIAEVLRPAAAGLSKQGRQYMMDQAIAHVLIHEWIHIATQSTRHSSRGISQAYLSVNDLIEEPKNNHLSAVNR